MTIDLEIDVALDDLNYDKGRLQTVTGTALKLQRIRNRILTVKGEWFLDLDYGLDYRGVIWNKRTPRHIVSAHIRREILKAADPGDVIENFEYVYTASTRTLAVTATITGAGVDAVLTIP